MVGLLVAGVHPAGAASDRYQVRRGDTLSAIASRLGVSTSRLAQANGIADPNHVVAGTWLRKPSGSGGSGASGSGGGSSSGSSGQVHVVRVGETLSGIAGQFHLSTAALVQANRITNPDRVYVGTRLTIPALGSGGSSGSSSSAGAAAFTGPTSGGSTSLPQRLQNSPSRLALMPTFDQWSAAYGVPADLVKAVTWLESGWQQGVVSSTGAIGIGQLMPITVVTVNRLMGTSLNPWVPRENIRMSARYLALLLSTTGGDTNRALAGYYQGLASVARNGLYPSTIAYVNGVQALRSRF